MEELNERCYYIELMEIMADRWQEEDRDFEMVLSEEENNSKEDKEER